ncbi:transcriptional coactivator p15/PC4 family protein [Sphingomonas sp. RB1R13]|uniref:transcriptional coactivator p15/PC4 family protein n=1 Tax=Sphingomonas sp. RB1R13 TaxID=3096159 RepID=UPI002FC97A28
MTAILFEQPYRGDLWRLEVATHEGRTFGNWRKWYRDGDTLKPTRQGVTFPVERLDELQAALTDYLADPLAT